MCVTTEESPNQLLRHAVRSSEARQARRRGAVSLLAQDKQREHLQRLFFIFKQDSGTVKARVYLSVHPLLPRPRPARAAGEVRGPRPDGGRPSSRRGACTDTRDACPLPSAPCRPPLTSHVTGVHGCRRRVSGSAARNGPTTAPLWYRRNAEAARPRRAPGWLERPSERASATRRSPRLASHPRLCPHPRPPAAPPGPASPKSHLSRHVERRTPDSAPRRGRRRPARLTSLPSRCLTPWPHCPSAPPTTPLQPPVVGSQDVEAWGGGRPACLTVGASARPCPLSPKRGWASTRAQPPALASALTGAPDPLGPAIPHSPRRAPSHQPLPSTLLSASDRGPSALWPRAVPGKGGRETKGWSGHLCLGRQPDLASDSQRQGSRQRAGPSPGWGATASAPRQDLNSTGARRRACGSWRVAAGVRLCGRWSGRAGRGSSPDPWPFHVKAHPTPAKGRQPPPRSGTPPTRSGRAERSVGPSPKGLPACPPPLLPGDRGSEKSFFGIPVPSLPTAPSVVRSRRELERPEARETSVNHTRGQGPL